MVVVILIVGMIFGVAIVKLDSVIPDSRLKQQIRKTVSLIDLAGAQAATEGRPLVLIFNRETRTITLEYSKDETLVQNVEFIDKEKEEEPPLYDSTWDEHIELAELKVSDLDGEHSDSDRIVFLPEGSCDGAIILWKDDSGIKQSMELWPLLSKVSIAPLDRSEVWK